MDIVILLLADEKTHGLLNSPPLENLIKRHRLASEAFFGKSGVHWLNDTTGDLTPDEYSDLRHRGPWTNMYRTYYWMPQMVDLTTGRATSHLQWALGTILPSMDNISFQLNLKTCSPSLCHNMIHKAALHNLVFAWYPCHIPMFWLV